MRVGIIGNGIVGTAIAATLVKHRPSLEIKLIDDGRPRKTSQAGQGYLFSIHRFDDTVGLETSVMAKSAWIDLLDENCRRNEEDRLLQKSGSLLIAPNHVPAWKTTTNAPKKVRTYKIWNSFPMHRRIMGSFGPARFMDCFIPRTTRAIHLNLSNVSKRNFSSRQVTGRSQTYKAS